MGQYKLKWGNISKNGAIYSKNGAIYLKMGQSTKKSLSKNIVKYRQKNFLGQLKQANDIRFLPTAHNHTSEFFAISRLSSLFQRNN